jgi:hypothetical protein
LSDLVTDPLLRVLYFFALIANLPSRGLLVNCTSSLGVLAFSTRVYYLDLRYKLLLFNPLEVLLGVTLFISLSLGKLSSFFKPDESVDYCFFGTYL